MKSDYRMGMGASSVLMILVVLAMTALGLLSLGSARQTEAQTKRNLQTTLHYYEAAADVQKALAELDEALYELQADGESLDTATLATRMPHTTFRTEADGSMTFELLMPAGDEHQLVVRGDILAANGARYAVNEHALVSTYVAPEQTLTLIGE